MDETALRKLLDSALDGEPPLGPVAQNSLRAGIKLRRRRRIRSAAGSVAAAAAIAVAIPAGIRAIGHTPGPVTGHRAVASTVYVAYAPDSAGQNTVVPISTTTSTAGKPIRLRGLFGAVAITPDGKTLYVSSPEGPAGAVIPISTTTNTAGKPIRIPIRGADRFAVITIAITPDGRTLYAAAANTVIPINTATNTPGKPIRIPIRGANPFAVITP